MHACVHVCVCVAARAHACVRACAHACLCAFVGAWCVHACVHACVRGRVRVRVLCKRMGYPTPQPVMKIHDGHVSGFGVFFLGGVTFLGLRRRRFVKNGASAKLQAGIVKRHFR